MTCKQGDQCQCAQQVAGGLPATLEVTTLRPRVSVLVLPVADACELYAVRVVCDVGGRVVPRAYALTLLRMPRDRTVEAVLDAARAMCAAAAAEVEPIKRREPDDPGRNRNAPGGSWDRSGR